MRLRLKGINCVKTRLASGRVVAYWYAWKSGPRLRGEPGSPEFIASYNEAVAQKITPPSGVLMSVLQGYQTSENFRQIAKSTRRSYIALIKRIEAKFGSFPLSAMTDRRTRGVFMAWRDELAIDRVAGRRITLGVYWRLFSRGLWTAVLWRPTHAKKAVASIEDRGPIKSGPPTMKRPF